VKTNVGKPIEETVRLRAYYRFLNRERDARDGSAVDDWLLAEAELAGQTEQPESHAHVVAGHGAGGHAEAERGHETEQPESHPHVVAGHGAGGHAE
jgi:hypothetical protein